MLKKRNLNVVLVQVFVTSKGKRTMFDVGIVPIPFYFANQILCGFDIVKQGNE